MHHATFSFREKYLYDRLQSLSSTLFCQSISGMQISFLRHARTQDDASVSLITAGNTTDIVTFLDEHDNGIQGDTIM